MHANILARRPIPRRGVPARLATAATLALLAACSAQARPSVADRQTAAPSVAEATPAAPQETTAWRREPPSELTAERPLRAAFLVVDGVYDSELTAPLDVFHHTRFHTGGRPAIETFLVSPDGGPVTTFEGLRLVPDHGFADAPPIDLLVVPSAEGSMGVDLADRRLIDWVRRTGETARYVVSLCDGAFVLAEAGLLDGRAATTFPADYDRFAQRYPRVDLRVNVSFVHDGRLLTSQGGVRSYDVAMYLVEQLYGAAVADGVGEGLLIRWPPEPERAPPYTIVPQP